MCIYTSNSSLDLQESPPFENLVKYKKAWGFVCLCAFFILFGSTQWKDSYIRGQIIFINKTSHPILIAVLVKLPLFVLVLLLDKTGIKEKE